MSNINVSSPIGEMPGFVTKKPIWKRVADPKIAILIGGFLIIWQIVSMLVPSNTVPKISAVLSDIVETVTSAYGLQNLFTTLARVGVGLVCSFAVGLVLGLLAGANPVAAGYFVRVVRFIQGIPSLSLVVIAVVWFSNIEVGIFFVIFLVCLPGFALQTYDSYSAIPTELRDMARSFRPERWSLFRELTLPSMTPDLFTAWKVNAGLGIRMVLVAELVGAQVGVGAQLLSAEQLFDMASVVSWTLLLAISMLIMQAVIGALESYALRYRAVPQVAAKQSRVSADLGTSKG